MIKPFLLPLLIALVVVVAGCGGGGNGEEAPPANQGGSQDTTPSDQQPADAQAGDGVGSQDPDPDPNLEEPLPSGVVVYDGVVFSEPDEIILERLIVKLKSPVAASPGASLSTAKTLLQDESGLPLLSVQTSEPLSLLRQVSGDTYVLSLPQGVSLREMLTILNDIQTDPNVVSVEPDWPIHPMVTPTDPGYGNQWALSASASVPGAGNLPAAWDITTGSSDVTVAVLDTGIVSSHVDVASRLVAGYDFIANLSKANDGDGRDSNPEDTGNWCDSPASNSNWHGTMVAGTIGAVANNGQGGAGVDWQARLQSIRVLGKCGGYTSDLIDAIRWAAGLNVSGIASNTTPAQVINMSLGGLGTCGATLQSAIDEAYNAGSVLIVAAGNDNDNASNYTPAVCNRVITVAATGYDGERASYSNYGASVEIAAPGGNSSNLIYAPSNDGTQGQINNTYTYAQGTSLAAPHVAGIASLMLAANYAQTGEFLSPATMSSKLLATVNAFPTGTALDCDTANCGAGIVDAAAAVLAVSTPPTVDAGANRNVSASQLVTLTVTVSDDGSGPFTYQWTQTAGNAVTLSGATSASVSFTTAVTSEVLTLQVSVTDDVGLVASDSVNVTVSGSNTAPVAIGSALSATEDTLASASLSGSDSDGNTLTFHVVTPPAHGDLTSFNTNTGSYSYTPDANYSGADSFTFEVNDGLANSAPATISISIAAVDDPPLANDTTLNVTTGNSITAAVSGSDPDGDTLTYALTIEPGDGVVSNFNSATGSFTYTPGAFSGTTQFTFSVTDGNSAPDYGMVSIVVAGTPQVSANASLPSPQAPGVAITFSALASETGNYEYEFWLKGPNTGNVWVRQQAYSTTATWTWQTVAGDVGTSTIWINSRLVGGNATFSTMSLDYVIDDGNQGPTPTSLTLQVQADTDRTTTLTASDPESDTLSFALLSDPTHGAILSFDSASGTLTYRPTNGYSGPDSIDYRVTDSVGNSATQTLSITVVAANNPPQVNNGVLAVLKNTTTSGNVAATDADNDVLRFAVYVNPRYGSMTAFNSATGAFSYKPNKDYVGSDSFRFSVDDGKTTVYGTISITVAAQATTLLSSNLASPQTQGASIELQASVSGLTQPEYAFWIQGPGTANAWQLKQAYSSDATWTWTTTASDVGTTTIWVYVREAGTTQVYATASLSFVVSN